MSELTYHHTDGLCIADGEHPNTPLILASADDCAGLLSSLRTGNREYVHELNGILVKITSPDHHALNALVDEDEFTREIRRFFPSNHELGVLIHTRFARAIWIGNIDAIERASNNSPYCLFWTLQELRNLLGGTR